MAALVFREKKMVKLLPAMPMLMFSDDVCVRLVPFGTMVASPSTELHDPDHFK